MAPITVKAPSESERRAHPREFALLKRIESEGGVDEQKLLAEAETYGNVDLAKEAASKKELDFQTFANIFKAKSQDAEGEGNTLGWAARDKSAVLAPLRFARRDLAPNDIYIQITHAGMCHSDLHTINGDWGDARYPVVPGHEIAGIVIDVGSEVKKFKPGDRAGASVFVDSCKECKYCTRHDELYCPKAVMTYNSVNYDGSPAQGGYSTHIVVHERYALTIPLNLPLAGVAPLLCAGITTYTPFKQYGLDKKGAKIGVNGLGGLGHMAVKWGVAFGAEVVVLSRSKAKEADAKRLGASHILVSSDEEAMKAEAGSFDGIIDTVSANHDLNALLKLLDVKGKLVVVGLPPGETVPISHKLLIHKALTFGGSIVGQLNDLQAMLDFCGEQNVVSDVEVVKADYVNTAMERMAKGDVKFRFVIDVLASMIA